METRNWKFPGGSLMNLKEIRSTGALFLIGCSLAATAQDTFVVPDGTPFIEGFGHSTNIRVTFPASNTYVVSSTFFVSSCVLTAMDGPQHAEDAVIRFRNSGIPFLFCDLKFPRHTRFEGTRNFLQGPREVIGSLPGFLVSSGSTWQLEFVETIPGTINSVHDFMVSGLIVMTSVAPTDLATSQEFVINGTTPFIDFASSANNTVITFPNTAGRVLVGNRVLLKSGVWRALLSNSFGDEARVRIRHSSSPGYADFSLLTGHTVATGLGTDVPLTGAQGRLATLRNPYSPSLVNSIVSAGGNWSLEFFEDRDNGVYGIPESSVTDLRFGLVSVPISTSKFKWTTPGPLSLAEDARQPTNGTHTPAHSVADEFILGPTFVLNSATLNEVDRHVLARNGAFRITNSAHPGKYAEAQFTGAGNYTSGFNVPASIGTLRGSLLGHLMPVGSRFSFEVFHSDNIKDPDRIDGRVEQTVTNVDIDLTSGPAFVPGAPPTAFDLGAVNDVTSPIVNTGPFADNQVKWYKLTIPDIGNNGLYLDIFTEAIMGNNRNTFLALWTSDGRLVNEDDDDGPDIQFSALSFGDLGPRPGGMPNGHSFNGRDGVLRAGTYYISIAIAFEYPVYGDAPFEIIPNTTRMSIGNTLVVRTNIPGRAVLSGVVSLSDSDSDLSNETVSILVQNGTVSQSFTTRLNASGSYSVRLPQSFPHGTYDVYIKGDTFLRKRISGVSFGIAGAQVNVNLRNGDVDGDNEVGPNDFALLAAAFGSSAGGPGYFAAADLDDSGNVGPADFSILAASFGEFGD